MHMSSFDWDPILLLLNDNQNPLLTNEACSWSEIQRRQTRETLMLIFRSRNPCFESALCFSTILCIFEKRPYSPYEAPYVFEAHCRLMQNHDYVVLTRRALHCSFMSQTRMKSLRVPISFPSCSAMSSRNSSLHKHVKNKSLATSLTQIQEGRKQSERCFEQQQLFEQMNQLRIDALLLQALQKQPKFGLLH